MTEKLYPVYVSHVWELLAVINSFTKLAQHRRQAGKTSKLDGWLEDFTERLELLASYMIHGQKDGIVYLRKDDRELIEKISGFIVTNGLH